MRLPALPTLLLLPTLTHAVLTKKHIGSLLSSLDAAGSGVSLVARDCTIHSTCAECFGEGSRICSVHYCYTPGEGHGEQCCKDGTICVSKTNACCSENGGPGISGPPGNPVPMTDLPSETGTATSSADYASVTCGAGESGDSCCQRASPLFHFCPGAKSRARGCYNLISQTCCTDGTVCEGEDCCDVVGAEPTAPYSLTGTWTKYASSTAGAGSGSSRTTTGGDSSAPTDGSGAGVTTTAGAGSGSAPTTDVSTSTPTGAAATNAIGGAVALAVGALGVAML